VTGCSDCQARRLFFTFDGLLENKVENLRKAIGSDKPVFRFLCKTYVIPAGMEGAAATAKLRLRRNMPAQPGCRQNESGQQLIRHPLHKLSVTFRNFHLIVINGQFAPQKYLFHFSSYLHALIGGIVHIHVMRSG